MSGRVITNSRALSSKKLKNLDKRIREETGLPVCIADDPLYSVVLEGVISDKTRAILPVHLYGLPAMMDPIFEVARAHGIAVIEDAAQALGAEYSGIKVGNIGTIGCFSFFPSKNLGGAGDGGMLTTNDPSLAERLRLLRVHGCRRKYRSEILGINSRLDALQAAILRVKLDYLEIWTGQRRHNAERYCLLFQDFGLDEQVICPAEPAGMRHVYNQFVIHVSARDELQQHLRHLGIPTEIYYPEPLHLQPAFAYLGYEVGNLPQAESASNHVLALPIYPELTRDQQMAVVCAIAQFYEGNPASFEQEG